MKKIVLAGLCIPLVLAATFSIGHYFDRPPREKQLMETFHVHQADYENLRNLLQQDKNLVRVAPWGIQTKNSVVPHPPSGDDLAPERYGQYLELFKKTGTKWASRGANCSDVCVGMWGWGFAGNTRRVDVCWIEIPPLNQIASLDKYYRDEKRQRDAFRHIESNWYLWTDW